ncbi:hypothetical protein BDZ97DRAFT_1781320 [Flammula alnicola]|nr:hypothetical protein BDZ97DRAFT_1781320 [Flammula alnicola]
MSKFLSLFKRKKNSARRNSPAAAAASPNMPISDTPASPSLANSDTPASPDMAATISDTPSLAPGVAASTPDTPASHIVAAPTSGTTTSAATSDDIPAPPAQTTEGPSSDSRTDKALKTTQSILKILQGVSALAPVPFLKDCIGLASTLIGMVQNVIQNQGDLEGIVQETSQLLICISTQCEKFEESGLAIPEEFTPMIEALDNALKEIQGLCEKCTSQSRFTQFMNQDLVKQNIAQIRGNLQYIFRVFDVSAVVSEIRFRTSWRSDNERLLREILDSLRDKPLYRPATNSHVTPVQARVQVYHGSQSFEKRVDNENIDDDSDGENRTVPIQAYSGNQVFKGPVSNKNVVKSRRR